jgi:acyl carrier protein
VKEKIIKIISDALTEINEELDYDSLNNISESTEIFGGDEGLDSLSLVRLVTEVEMNVNDEFDSSVLLASEKAMSMRNSPYRNVASLTEFVMGELEGNN